MYSSYYLFVHYHLSMLNSKELLKFPLVGLSGIVATKGNFFCVFRFFDSVEFTGVSGCMTHSGVRDGTDSIELVFEGVMNSFFLIIKVDCC